MSNIAGALALAAASTPTEAYGRKLAMQDSSVLNLAIGNAAAPYINGVAKPAQQGFILPMPFRFQPNVVGGKKGFHIGPGESLYVIAKPTATATFLASGGSNSVLYVQVAVYDANTGAFKEVRIYQYADIYTTAPQGISGNPVLAANRDNIAAAFTPMAAGECGVVHGGIRVQLDTA
jgi:hypothetical protein